MKIQDFGYIEGDIWCGYYFRLDIFAIDGNIFKKNMDDACGIVVWCDEQLINYNSRYLEESFDIWINKETDAMAFKLMWG